MRNIVKALGKVPKQVFALVAVATAVVAVSSAALAWGPSRPTYTVQNPAEHVTFNSITNNPNIGDERNFVGIREAGSTSTWNDSMNVQPGKEYTVRVYVHNDAATSLNASGKGVAKDTTAYVNLPTSTGKSIEVDGTISASNASPKSVWDQATFTSSQDFNLAYVPGTLKYENNAGTFTLPQSIFTSTGAKLGYNSMNGTFPGCFSYAGYITFTVKPQFAPKPSFTMSKMVSKHGVNKWGKSYTAQPGETVDYLVQYQNTGDVQQNNVVMQDNLPTGETYVNGSSVLGNALHPSGVKTNDDIVTSHGINVGSYGHNGNAWVIFSAKVANADQLTCGAQSLVNKATVTTDYGSKSDTATVTVNGKNCAQPIQVCDRKTQTIVTIDKSQLDSSLYSTNPADCTQTPTTPTTPATPATPTVTALPHTGPADTLAKLFGAVSLTSAVAYYISSRRNLN